MSRPRSGSTTNAAASRVATAPMASEFGLWRRILVAVDGSAHSRLALLSAADLALRSNAELLILSVSTLPGVSPALALGMAVDFGDQQQRSDLATIQVISDAARCVSVDVKVTTRFRRGVPAHEILQQVKDGRHDLVVLGSRGRGRISGLFSSVSHEVLHHSPVAVMVMHAAATHDATGDGDGDVSRRGGRGPAAARRPDAS